MTQNDYKNLDEKELLEAFTPDFTAMIEGNDMQIWGLTKLEAWCAMSCIQLASRHPGNDGHTAEKARNVAELFERVLASTPALKEVARRGWLEKFDTGTTLYKTTNAAGEEVITDAKGNIVKIGGPL